MARREWQQLELGLPIAGDVGATYRTSPTRRLSRPTVPDASTLSDVALLTSLLGPAAEDAVDALVATYGSLRRLSQAHPADLRDRGIRRTIQHRLAIVFEIARRYGEEEFIPGQPFRGSADVNAHYRERLAVGGRIIVAARRWWRGQTPARTADIWRLN